MKFILATKEHMTQHFAEDGTVSAATILKAGPMTATQVKSKERDGYYAVQFGFGNSKHVNKPQKGHFKGKGDFHYVREYRLKEGEGGAEEGSTVDVSIFNPGDTVEVSGVIKGHGFTGVVKRHGFSGGPRTHGQKHSEREPGSIGATWPQRVIKGMRMAGRMGGNRVTVKNLKILAVDKENNLLLVSGAVPGRKGTLIEVRALEK